MVAEKTSLTISELQLTINPLTHGMKLLVFAHTPPPHHGQSYMVQLMLEGLGGDHRTRKGRAEAAKSGAARYGVECYHVNARLSKKLEDIGDLRIGKLVL